MKTAIALVLFTTVGFGTLALNPRRFQATSITNKDGLNHLEGDVRIHIESAIVDAQSADFTNNYEIRFNGSSRWELLQVQSQPDFNSDYMTNPRPLDDPGRFNAQDIRKVGNITHLHGAVVITIPGIRIEAEDVDFNSSTLTLDIDGNSTLVFMKALVKPDDGLGPIYITR